MKRRKTPTTNQPTNPLGPFTALLELVYNLWYTHRYSGGTSGARNAVLCNSNPPLSRGTPLAAADCKSSNKLFIFNYPQALVYCGRQFRRITRYWIRKADIQDLRVNLKCRIITQVAFILGYLGTGRDCVRVQIAKSRE